MLDDGCFCLTDGYFCLTIRVKIAIAYLYAS